MVGFGLQVSSHILSPAGIYLLKVNNRKTRTRCAICSKLTIKTPERRHRQLGAHYRAFWAPVKVFNISVETSIKVVCLIARDTISFFMQLHPIVKLNLELIQLGKKTFDFDLRLCRSFL